jgi:hypothetical protein
MAITFNCAQCGKSYTLDDSLAGKQAQCACGTEMTVPAPSPAPVAPVSPFAAPATGQLPPAAPMPESPYSPPGASFAPHGRAPGGREEALRRVKMPALLMMITTGIMLCLYPIALIINLVKIGQGAQGGGQQADLAVVDGVAGIIGIVLGLIMSVVILIGAKKMMKLESYGFAMTTMILSMLPCFSPCCIFGLPIGIWGIIVLNDENVKAAFRRG